MDGFRPDAIVIDAPRFSRFHLPKFIVFLGVEGLLIATGVLAYSEPVPKLCICSRFLKLLISCVLRCSLVPLVAVLPHWCQASLNNINPLTSQIGLLPAGGGANIPQELRIGGCQRLDYRCEISTAVTVLVAIIVACFIG